jgi:hypothetical protein
MERTRRQVGIERGAREVCRDGCNGSVQAGACDTYHVALDAIGDALDDALYGAAVVPVRFVVAEPHHAPVFAISIPVYFDDSFVQLFAARFHPDKKTELWAASGHEGRKTHCSHSPSVTCMTS